MENKILEVEESIQKLGVKLGEFDTENEFCTIKFSLSESGKPNKSWFSKFIQRVKNCVRVDCKILFASDGIIRICRNGDTIIYPHIRETKNFPGFT